MTQLRGINNTASAGLPNNPALGAICTAIALVLKDGIDVHRCLAAQALGKIGAKESVQPLIDALMDEDEDVRTDAAEALERIGDPVATDQLFKNLLDDPCTEVKLAAIKSLASLQDRRVIPWLRRMVLGRDEEITWDENEFFSSGWDDWVEIQASAIAALAKLGASEAVDDIVSALNEENAQDITEMAFKALSTMGQPGIDALVGYLDAPTTRLRRRAGAVLASVCPDVSDGPLARVFSDPSAEVRLAALRSRAAESPDDIWISVLLKDDDPEIRAEAVSLTKKAYAEDLYALLDDASADVQTAALRAFAGAEGASEVAGASEKLIEKSNDPSPDVSAAAAKALSGIAPDIASEVLAVQLADSDLGVANRIGAMQGLAQIGDTASLIAVIDDAERQIRLETLAALAQVSKNDPHWPNSAGDALLAALGGSYAPEPVEEVEEIVAETDTGNSSEELPEEPEETPTPTSTLSSILEDVPELANKVGLPEGGVELSADDMERLAIARQVVGKRKIPRAVEVVVHEDIQRFAATVLGDLDRPDVALALAETLGNADATLAGAAAHSIASIAERNQALPEEVVPIITEQLAKATRDQKLPLIRALSVCDRDEVVAALLGQLADEDSFVRSDTIRSLSKASAGDVDFEPMLTDADPSVRLCAAKAVADASGSGSVERLVEFAFSFEGHHGRQTARILRKLDTDQAGNAMLQVLNDPDRRRVWPVAIQALEELYAQQEQNPGSVL